MEYLALILGALVLILGLELRRAVVFLAWRPFQVTRFFMKQGVYGPKYKFWSGSLDETRNMTAAARDTEMDVGSHDIVPRVLPEYTKWISQYGGTFLYWFGAQPRLCITDPEQIKQVLSNKFGFYTKIKPNSTIITLLGRGLVVTEGSEWSRHRRVVSPAFAMDKLKMMTKRMADCTLTMLENWKDHLVQAGEVQSTVIEVNQHFQELTADVISHAAFGSSYVEGKAVFAAQKELQMLALPTRNDVDVPGIKYLPTRRNIQKWKLDRKIKNSLVSIIGSRLNSGHLGYGNDLLGLMIESTRKQEGTRMNMDEIIDECKTFFFVGHETSSHLLSWTIFLLSTNQEWQERLRREVVSECGTEIPNADNISKLKMVTMVLLETLRLYCPVIRMFRKAAKDMNLGGLSVPKDTTVTVPIAIIHRSKELWGDDANEFNPMRFENGITKAAKHPNALLAFSLGPRVCVGQNFAMLEAKMVIALILQRFSFALSPTYRHQPADMLTLQPQSGLPIVLNPVHVRKY